jgi:hypothetical protein
MGDDDDVVAVISWTLGQAAEPGFGALLVMSAWAVFRLAIESAKTFFVVIGKPVGQPVAFADVVYFFPCCLLPLGPAWAVQYP